MSRSNASPGIPAARKAFNLYPLRSSFTTVPQGKKNHPLKKILLLES